MARRRVFRQVVVPASASAFFLDRFSAAPWQVYRVFYFDNANLNFGSCCCAVASAHPLQSTYIANLKFFDHYFDIAFLNFGSRRIAVASMHFSSSAHPLPFAHFANLKFLGYYFVNAYLCYRSCRIAVASIHSSGARAV